CPTGLLLLLFSPQGNPLGGPYLPSLTAFLGFVLGLKSTHAPSQWATTRAVCPLCGADNNYEEFIVESPIYQRNMLFMGCFFQNTRTTD
uniref:Uncharacterized protein n=1 Tax=Otus sunia TaxID=257818 RepID=A0A8C8AJG2_9STRI